MRVGAGLRARGRNIDGFTSVNERYLVHRLAAQRAVAIYFPFVLLLSDLATALVLGAGAASAAAAIATAGVVIAFLLYLDQFFAPIQQLSQVLDTWQQATVSVVKIDELLDTPERVVPPASPVSVGRLRGEVRFDDVHFAYSTSVGAEALGGIDLTSRAGRDRGAGGRDRRRQVDDRQADRPLLPARPGAGSPSTDSICVTSTSTASGASWASCPRRPSCSPGRSATTSPTAGPRPHEAEVEGAARAVGAHDSIASRHKPLSRSSSPTRWALAHPTTCSTTSLN